MNMNDLAASGTNNVIDLDNDKVSGMPVDYETVWSNEWINPVYENLHKWTKILEKMKIEPERDEMELINGKFSFHIFSPYK